MEWLTHSQTGFQQAARYLLAMRLTLVALQLIAIAVAETMVTLAHRAEALIVCLVYAVVATVGWLWFTRRPPRSTATVSLVLTADLLLIGAWLYLTGGYTNPLVSLLLLPIAVAIILLPPGQSIAVTVAGVAVYTSLVLWHTPVIHEHHSGNLAQLHLVGMWVTFAISAAILLLVVGALSRRLRQQQLQLAQVRETRLRDEQIIALGLSAAAVAHRLGTPLNTMTLLVDEMKAAAPSGEPLSEDLSLMEKQLSLCSRHLQQLSTAAMQARAAQLEIIDAPDWIMRLRESATLLWPGATIEWQQPFPDCRVAVDATLDQAVLNLLANAITASPVWVAISAREGIGGRLEIIIEDHGDGLESALEDAPGEQVVSSENGLGVGLFLSNATIQRLGGTLKASVTSQGTTMIIDLPVATDHKNRRGGSA
ncbi:sensor histidine kinase [Marinobacter orientalis]|uniref:histidine kinase n=1 Tax=Marinobacter orientalis TaxID=1928859 RepID=A0A7Y0RB66_9GAMM|nr:HAMP domain-containing sensor histidine kinase [Marinobacter orientalis]NMT62998.1 HAMP domain-containing histidine kinase [Marinobacter orientalis]TGX51663.1 HAMP domain-containing histidine kinase [Marinobacter orientalis]